MKNNQTEVKERAEIIVNLRSLKRISVLKKAGHLQYLSKQMHYAVLSIDKSRLKAVQKRLQKLNFVSDVLYSPLADLSKELIDKTVQESVDEDV